MVCKKAISELENDSWSLVEMRRTARNVDFGDFTSNEL
jgi:hypothetical protein